MQFSELNGLPCYGINLCKFVPVLVFVCSVLLFVLQFFLFASETSILKYIIDSNILKI